VAIALAEVVIFGAETNFDVGQFRQLMEMAPAETAQAA
jgi:hypothetical protein